MKAVRRIQPISIVIEDSNDSCESRNDTASTDKSDSSGSESRNINDNNSKQTIAIDNAIQPIVNPVKTTLAVQSPTPSTLLSHPAMDILGANSSLFQNAQTKDEEEPLKTYRFEVTLPALTRNCVTCPEISYTELIDKAMGIEIDSVSHSTGAIRVAKKIGKEKNTINI